MKQHIKPRQQFLMTPGPVTVADNVSTASAQPIIFHRSNEFQALFSRVCKKLLPIFGASQFHKVLLLTGSGTLANEATLSSIFNQDDKVLVLSNGDFGERLIKILEIHQIQYKPFRVPWGDSFN